MKKVIASTPSYSISPLDAEIQITAANNVYVTVIPPPNYTINGSSTFKLAPSQGFIFKLTGINYITSTIINPPTTQQSVTSVFSRKGNVEAVDGDYTAEQITNTPTAPITATNVQDAIDEIVTLIPATPSLATVLSTGNTTGGTDIVVSAGDDITLTDATASRIAQIDASKQIDSLDTATYPSLTELSYVKGVTSSVQTQLDARIAKSILTAQGDIIYASAASTPAVLAKDTNTTRYLSNQGASNNPSWNQVNLTNGTTGILPATQGGNNVILSTTTVSGVATATFTGFSSTYSTYVIEINNMTVSINNVLPFLRIGTGAGFTIQSGANDYGWTFLAQFANSATSGTIQLADYNDTEIQLSGAISNAANSNFHTTITIVNPSQTTLYHPIEWNAAQYYATGEETDKFDGEGNYKSITAITAAQISVSAGTFSGILTLYGVA